MRKLSIVLPVALAVILAAAPLAVAVPTIDFGIIAPTTGSISYAGGGAALVGTDISVDNVVGLGTPANAEVTRTCIGCDLDFTTGLSTGGTPGAGGSWTFASGGAITITGGVDLTGNGVLGDGGDIPAGTTLLTGSWSGTVTVLDLGEVFQIVGGAFVDTKHNTLEAFYGLLTDPLWFGSLNLSFTSAGVPPGAFSSTLMGSGNVLNQVAEPSTLAFVGFTLVGLGLLARRLRPARPA